MRLDGGAWIPSTSPKLYSGLGDGPHTFDVRATDAAGNVDLSPASFAWTVDTIGAEHDDHRQPVQPDERDRRHLLVHLQRGLARPSSAGSTAAPGARARRRASTALSPRAPTPSTCAPTDAASNTDATPATFIWSIDFTSPTGSITSPADGALVRAHDPARKQLGRRRLRRRVGRLRALARRRRHLDCDADELGHDARRRRGLRPARRDLRCRRATSRCRPRSPSRSTTRLRTRASRPSRPTRRTPRARRSPSRPRLARRSRFASTAAPGARAPARRATAASRRARTPSRCVPPISPATSTQLRPPSPGRSTRRHRTRTSPRSPPTRRTRPARPSRSPRPRSARPSRFASTAAPGAPSASPTAYSGLSEGSHTFQVRATDAAGNQDATQASYTWTVDTTAPNSSFASTPADPSSDTTPTFGFASTEAPATYEVNLDGGGWVARLDAPDDLPRSLRRLAHAAAARERHRRQPGRHRPLPTPGSSTARTRRAP